MKRAWVVLAALTACQSGAPTVPAVDAAVYARADDPQGRQAWERAQAALQRGDAAAAIPDLRIAVERCPDLVRAHLAFQDAARRLGGEAEQQMRAFYAALPDGRSPVPAYARIRLADTSYAQGTGLQAILAAHPSFAWAHLSLGRVRRGQGQLLPAAESFQAAIAADAELLEARLERAQALAELGRYEEAAVDYAAYLKSRPADEAAQRAYLSMLIYKLRRIDAALPILVEVEARHGGDPAVRMDRAAAQWIRGDARGSVEIYLQVLETRPEEARAALNIGLLYYEVLARTEADRRLFWPRARAAFRWFLQCRPARDGHEAFERAIAVPYRLEVIAGLLGSAEAAEVTLADLRLPPGG